MVVSGRFSDLADRLTPLIGLKAARLARPGQMIIFPNKVANGLTSTESRRAFAALRPVCSEGCTD